MIAVATAAAAAPTDAMSQAAAILMALAGPGQAHFEPVPVGQSSWPCERDAAVRVGHAVASPVVASMEDGHQEAEENPQDVFFSSSPARHGDVLNSGHQEEEEESSARIDSDCDVDEFFMSDRGGRVHSITVSGRGTSSDPQAVRRVAKRIRVQFDEVIEAETTRRSLNQDDLVREVLKGSSALSLRERQAKFLKVGEAVMELLGKAVDEAVGVDMHALLKNIPPLHLFAGVVRRGGFTEKDLKEEEGIGISHYAFCASNPVVSTLLDDAERRAALQRQNLDALRTGRGRSRRWTSVSRSLVPFLEPPPSEKLCALLGVVVKLADWCSAASLVKLSTSPSSLDQLIARGLRIKECVAMRLRVDLPVFLMEYQTSVPPLLQYSVSYVEALLQESRFIGHSRLRAGLCNKCGDLATTLVHLEHLGAQFLSANLQKELRFLLGEFRQHVFHGLLHDCAGKGERGLRVSHNAAFLLGEAAGLMEGERCLACHALIAVGNMLCEAAPDATWQSVVVHEIKMCGFFLGHNVLKAEARRRLELRKGEVAKDASLCVLIVDMMMKIQAIRCNEVKKEWFGKDGHQSHAAVALINRGNGVVEAINIIVENDQLRDATASTLIGMIDATVSELIAIAPNVRRVCLFTDKGANFSCAQYVLECAILFSRHQLDLIEQVVFESGDGKGPADAAGGNVQNTIRRSVAKDPNGAAVSTEDRVRHMIGVDGKCKIGNTVLARVILVAGELEPEKNEGARSSQHCGSLADEACSNFTSAK